jgi:hypothetical protein
MDPITIAALGSTALSSIFGGLSENQASNINWAINEANRRDQNKWRQQGMDYAENIRGEQKLGSTNAAGDRTYFKPGVGWVTELGSRNRELLNYFFGTELPERRSQFARGAQRSRTESDVADQLLRQFQSVMKENPRDAEQMLFEAATRGINENTAAAMGSAMTAGLRSGSSNVGRIAGEIQRAAGKTMANAGKDARLQALDYVGQKYNQQRGAASQLYNLFASRAGQDIGSSYDPTGREAAANAQTGQMASLAAQGNSIGASAIGRNGGLYQPFEANNAIGNALGGVGASLGGAGANMQAQQGRDETNELLKQYISNGGNINLAAGGLGAPTIADRVRMMGGGSF